MLAALACAPHAETRIPSALSVLKTNWSPVISFLDSAVAGGAAPGAVLGVSVAGQRYIHATGRLTRGRRLRPSHHGLRSCVADQGGGPRHGGDARRGRRKAGAGCTGAAIRAGIPGEGEGAGDHPAAAGPRKRATCLAATVPGSRNPEEAFALADTTALSSPPGTADVYSDLGMIVLTQAVEAVYHERLDSLLARRIFQPLGMTSVDSCRRGASPDRAHGGRSLAGPGAEGRSAR